ncbi:hypothetical protein D1872_284650 [compost metagenome]
MVSAFQGHTIFHIQGSFGKEDLPWQAREHRRSGKIELAASKEHRIHIVHSIHSIQSTNKANSIYKMHSVDIESERS